MTRNKLASLTGVRFEVIDCLYRGDLERIDLDILARVCFVLKCEVKDILESVK
ncbi:Cro/Cl family transcriptional regulator [Christensenella hongkongensis]|nr:Cro/Cl family transcriptional regulator [Christensenella hongkongensis]